MNALRKLSKLAAPLASAFALNACAASQNVPASQEATVDDTRAALTMLHADQTGIRAQGPFVESIACAESGNQDLATQFASEDAKKALDEACGKEAPGGFVPKMQGKTSHSGNTHCVVYKTPVTDTCKSQ